ncbi:methyl-accepting chemotaxis protein [Piscinibacterium candidicorallinum]|uniref:Methyl-accepting chemotaxis protein n=1 Tax=Piscinibacterium candidicorallinum TaxID=1793872 RepID=A0ABV7HA80_9BURK
MNRFSIRARIAVAMLAVVATSLVITGIAIYQKHQLELLITELVGAQRERDDAAEAWDRGIVMNSDRWTTIAMAGSAETYNHLKPLIAEVTQNVTAVQKRFNEIETDPEAKKLVATLGERRTAWHAVRAKIQAAVEAGDFATARELGAGPFKDVTAQYLVASRALGEYQGTRTKKLSEQAQKDIDASQAMSVALLIISMVIGAVVGVGLTRAVLRPVNQAAGAVREIAQGNLAGTVETDAPTEFKGLMQDLAQMRSNLHDIVSQLAQTSESIRTASSEVAVGNQDLSGRTEQAASNLQQTAASMAQLSQTVNQNAEAARTASQLAASASSVAQQGGDVVGKVVHTMSDISTASRKISEIIGVIDGIAFQTNILALNASVEAARAGEQGRGFAVVASEVRNLAGRSAEAAKEIKTLIGASAEKVETGSQLVEQAGATMNEIVASVQRVTDMIGEITASTTEQASGITQVNQAVGQLDQMTQQNAALVEQSAAAAESLKAQAVQLGEVVGNFRLQRA